MCESGLLYKMRSAVLTAALLCSISTAMLAAEQKQHVVIHETQIVAPGASEELARSQS